MVVRETLAFLAVFQVVVEVFPDGRLVRLVIGIGFSKLPFPLVKQQPCLCLVAGINGIGQPLGVTLVVFYRYAQASFYLEALQSELVEIMEVFMELEKHAWVVWFPHRRVPKATKEYNLGRVQGAEVLKFD